MPAKTHPLGTDRGRDCQVEMSSLRPDQNPPESRVSASLTIQVFGRGENGRSVIFRLGVTPEYGEKPAG